MLKHFNISSYFIVAVKVNHNKIYVQITVRFINVS